MLHPLGTQNKIGDRARRHKQVTQAPVFASHEILTDFKYLRFVKDFDRQNHEDSVYHDNETDFSVCALIS